MLHFFYESSRERDAQKHALKPCLVETGHVFRTDNASQEQKKRMQAPHFSPSHPDLPELTPHSHPQVASPILEMMGFPKVSSRKNRPFSYIIGISRAAWFMAHVV
jgi:hypothetical protein